MFVQPEPPFPQKLTLPGLEQRFDSPLMQREASSCQSGFPMHFPGIECSVSLDVIKIARKCGIAQAMHGKNVTT